MAAWKRVVQLGLSSLQNFSASKVSAIPSMKFGSGSMFPVNRFDYRHKSELINTTGKQPSTGRVSCNLFEKRNIRDHKRRLLAEKYELKRKLHKAFCYDPNLPSAVRDTHRHKLSKLPRNSAFSRLRNRCVFTGRPRAVYSFFRTSRIVFRTLARQGSLVGVKKSSW